MTRADDGDMETRHMLIGCEFTYVAAVPTPTVFQVQPTESPGISVQDARWESDPPVVTRGYTDLYGNPCVRAVLPAGRSSFRYQAVAVVPDATEEADEEAPELPPHALPDDTLIYTLPSRYCLPDVLGTESWSRFGGVAPGYHRVQAICDYVHGHLTFQYGSSTALDSAVDVNRSGRGVCRDFTHLAISFCRALNIPARYVFGYLPDMDVPPDPAPMDFAAWMEVWLGDRWWTFDPRNNARRKGRVVIGRGRDASDVAMATTFGGPLLESMTVQAEEAPVMALLAAPAGVVAVAAAELLHPARGVDHARLAGVERVARRRDLHVDDGVGVAVFPLDRVAARQRGLRENREIRRAVPEDDGVVVGMNAWLHDQPPCSRGMRGATFARPRMFQIQEHHTARACTRG
jgi:transglutaminase-like putative cysteine protease